MESKVPSLKMNNGHSIPVLGMGTYQFKPNKICIQAIKDAIDAGYRHIDCALAYENEKDVGEALAAVFKEGKVKREDLFITSKLWCTYHSKGAVELGLKTTLKDLGLLYLDLYLIHWPQGFKEGGHIFPKDSSGKFIYSDVDYVETWAGMEAAVDKGLTSSIGVSNFNKSQIARILQVAKIKPAMLQIEVHPYLNQNKLIEFCRSQSIAVIAHSPLGSPDRPWAKPGEPKLMDDPRLKDIPSKYKKSLAQVLIRYALDRGLVVIPKSVIKSQIIENIDVWDFKITDEDMKQIASLECNRRLCFHSDQDHKYYPFHDEY